MTTNKIYFAIYGPNGSGLTDASRDIEKIKGWLNQEFKPINDPNWTREVTRGKPMYRATLVSKTDEDTNGVKYTGTMYTEAIIYEVSLE
jgi:hypothetical protein